MSIFAPRGDKQQIEESDQLAPKFDADGLIPCVTTDHQTGQLLMFAYMNAESMQRTIESGEAYYYSRSRKKLWHKGEESGLVQHVQQMLIDCDQDCIWLKVKVADVHGGASCHVGYRTCFYRQIPTGQPAASPVKLQFTETQKLFDPRKVYPGKT